MKKYSVVLFLSVATVFLAGCMPEKSSEAVIEQKVSLEESMEAAELSPEQAESQMVSDDDTLEVIESELDATVILEEDLSDL